ncbi:MAG TPA: hypothetical protein PLQ35_09215 [bacterium]|nr:hypothetical protein [bacterium]HQL62460.1 hypothetical protein [bacterium]
MATLPPIPSRTTTWFIGRLRDSHPRTPFQILGAHSNILLPTLSPIVILFLLYNPFLGHDIWWHIPIGQSIVFDHVSPNKDTFTYTIPGKEVVIHSCLAECLFTLLYRAAGEIEFYVFRFGSLLQPQRGSGLFYPFKAVQFPTSDWITGFQPCKCG